jgi:ankyrin repeat protein
MTHLNFNGLPNLNLNLSLMPTEWSPHVWVQQSGSNPLMMAAFVGHKDIVHALLRHPGIHINQVDHLGRCALSMAVLQKHTEVSSCVPSKLPKYSLNIPEMFPKSKMCPECSLNVP